MRVVLRPLAVFLGWIALLAWIGLILSGDVRFVFWGLALTFGAIVCWVGIRARERK